MLALQSTTGDQIFRFKLRRHHPCLAFNITRDTLFQPREIVYGKVTKIVTISDTETIRRDPQQHHASISKI
jgi:hypothetical protein